MKKIGKILTAILCAGTLLLLTACECRHEWVEATCTKPKTCTKCGETKGEAIGHKWEEATVDRPKTCSVCGLTEGEPKEMNVTAEHTKSGYDNALAYASQNGYEADFAYRDICNMMTNLSNALDTGDEDNRFKYTYQLFGDFTLSDDEYRQRLNDLEKYVLPEGDAFSALMRKFASMSSIKGTITPSEVDISAPDLANVINEMKIRPEILGGMLAMLDMYDYTWIKEDEPKLLQFTDTGFSFHWEALSDYTLDLG